LRKYRCSSARNSLDEAIRAGLAEARSPVAASFANYHMGEPLIELTKALPLAGQLEDEELARKLSQGR
jgi:hypothetical protein